jgi:hypothetical protein
MAPLLAWAISLFLLVNLVGGSTKVDSQLQVG